MYHSSEIYALIKQGESQHLDFKQTISSPEKIARTLVAFANTEGGSIVVGVDDRGDLTGIDPEQEKHILIRAGKKFCDPPIFIHFTALEEKKLSILIAEVEKSKKEHRALDEAGEWHFYVRVKDQTVRVAEIDEQLLADKRNLKPIPILLEENQGLMHYLEENESITVKEYMKMMNISYGIAKRSLNDLVENAVLGRKHIHQDDRYFIPGGKKRWRSK